MADLALQYNTALLTCMATARRVKEVTTRLKPRSLMQILFSNNQGFYKQGHRGLKEREHGYTPGFGTIHSVFVNLFNSLTLHHPSAYTRGRA